MTTNTNGADSGRCPDTVLVQKSHKRLLLEPSPTIVNIYASILTGAINTDFGRRCGYRRCHAKEVLSNVSYNGATGTTKVSSTYVSCNGTSMEVVIPDLPAEEAIGIIPLLRFVKVQPAGPSSP